MVVRRMSRSKEAEKRMLLRCVANKICDSMIAQARKIFNSSRWKWPSLERITSHNPDALTLFLFDAGPTRVWPDQNKFEDTLREGLRHREWRNAHARRRDMSGIQNGIDRETTAALHSKKDDLTEYKRACLRAIVCGGVHTAVRHKLHQTKGEETGVCPFCQCDSGESVFHRWWVCPHWAEFRRTTLQKLEDIQRMLDILVAYCEEVKQQPDSSQGHPWPPHIFVLGWSPQSAAGPVTPEQI
eukprot:s935_g23.t1